MGPCEALTAAISAAPNGARYFRCALHVNPFDYLVRHNRVDALLPDEASYNQGLIEACLTSGVEVIAITDHYRVKTSIALMASAADAGLIVLPGFEAVTKDGVHLLCIFNRGTSIEKVERVIGACGVHDMTAASPQGSMDAEQCLGKAREWDCTFIAAHVCSSGGLLTVLRGASRARVWASPNLLACSLPASASSAPQEHRGILLNQDPAYVRDHAVAVLNAQDVFSPSDVKKGECTCWIKMSEVTTEGLRQAFLEPQSRIRLSSDPEPDNHTEIVGLAWEGGFLDGQAVHFNENLNVLVGGRGTGKSTIVESIRYVLGLEAIGDEAKQNHDGIVSRVLRSGTRVTLVARSHHPTTREYVVERTHPNPPVVRDGLGTVLDVQPADVVQNVEVYGQHEIAELVRSPERLTRLLDRFMDRDEDDLGAMESMRRSLERNRQKTVQCQSDLDEVDTKLATLPALEETLKRYKDAGLELKLADKDALIREEAALGTARERVTTLDTLLAPLRDALPLDQDFLAAETTKDLPAADTLSKVGTALQTLSDVFEAAISALDAQIATTSAEINERENEWTMRRDAVEADFAKVLRELQQDRIDGEEFVRIRRQLEQLKPESDRKRTLERDLKKLKKERRELLSDWVNLQGKELRGLTRVADTVTRRLRGRVRVRVEAGSDLTPLQELLKTQVGGRLAEALEALRNASGFSVHELADVVEKGAPELQKRYGMPPAQANALASAGPELPMLIQEVELPVTTELELNVAAEGMPEAWHALSNLSTGQKATAVLLLLLLESEAPLVVDQPEDDLDNRFISDGVVPRMLDEKRRRQFIFATHNANIPVLGDAELILGLRATGDADVGHAEIPSEHMGSIDSAAVRDLVEEVLEGGREAFQTRKLKYGF